MFDGHCDTVIAELYQNPYQSAAHPVAHANPTSIIMEEWQAIFTGDQVELFASEIIGHQHNLAEQVSAKRLLTNPKIEMEKILVSDHFP